MNGRGVNRTAPVSPGLLINKLGSDIHRPIFVYRLLLFGRNYDFVLQLTVDLKECFSAIKQKYYQLLMFVFMK